MWKELRHRQEIDNIITASENKPQVIFKHSTRCNTSILAKHRIEKNFAGNDIDFYLLDLIQHRDLSNKIADMFGVYHESPQVLLIKNGECIYDESHLGINMDELIEQAL
ncbi:MAG: bacillithiol system redox-active protein YtxJ [Sphingobacteriales bacterium]|nr:MAG: bacillithiol system redox-active protein YtxJ [Sphingobacteriales bacterium]